MPAKTPDLVGQTFSDLYVKEIVPRPSHLKPHLSNTYYLCECHCVSSNCYQTLIVRKDNLVLGNTKSCKASKQCLKTLEEVHRSSFKSIWSKKRYTDGDLTFDQFYYLTQLPCFYCGKSPAQKHNDFIKNSGTPFSITNGTVFYNGLDRVDSSQAHNLANVVPCCPHCNFFKLDRSYENMLAHIPLLNSNFIYKNIDSLNYVRGKIKLAENGLIPYVNKKGKNPLAKMFPEKYGKSSRSYLYWRANIIIKNACFEHKAFELNIEETAELMMANCIYCNSPPDLINGKFNGIDRYINADEKGNRIYYTKENSVPACHYCNSGKRELTIEEFRAWIKQLQGNLINLPASFVDLMEGVKKRNLNMLI